MRKIFIAIMLCAALLVAPAFAQTWPNEQSGSTLVTDFGLDTLSGSGWNTVGGGCGVVSDATGPLSPPSVVEADYPTGFTAGNAPCTIYYPTANNKELYTGLWWKASNPWQQEPLSNMSKILFWASNTGFDMFCGMNGTGPYTLTCTPEFPGIANGHLPNSNGDAVGSRNLVGQTTVNMPLGQWHRLEFYYKFSTSATSQDGIIRWWVDGTLVGDYTTANFPAGNFSEFQISSTWGGLTSTKTENDWYRYDHVHLSIPPVGGGGGGASGPMGRTKGSRSKK